MVFWESSPFSNWRWSDHHKNQVLGAHPAWRVLTSQQKRRFLFEEKAQRLRLHNQDMRPYLDDRCNGNNEFQRVKEQWTTATAQYAKTSSSLVLCCFLDWCWWCVDGGNCRNGGMRMRGLYWVRRVDRNGNGEHKRVETNSWDQDLCCWICYFCLSLRIQTPPQNRIEGSNFILSIEMN